MVSEAQLNSTKSETRLGSPLPASEALASAGSAVFCRALVARVQAGDKSAFGQLYELYSPKIYGYLLYHLHGRTEIAEDLTADVFIKAFQSIGRFQVREVPFAAWLYRIARNHLIDFVRRQPKQPLLSVDDWPALQVESSQDAPAIALDREGLSRALKQLTDDQRRTVVLRILQGMSIAETARALNKTEDSIKQLQCRGLRALRRILDEDHRGD